MHSSLENQSTYINILELQRETIWKVGDSKWCLEGLGASSEDSQPNELAQPWQQRLEVGGPASEAVPSHALGTMWW